MGRETFRPVRSSTLSSSLIFIPHIPLDETFGLRSPSLASWNRATTTTTTNSVHSLGPPTTGSTRKRVDQSVGRAAKRRRITMQISEQVPEDLLTPIFEQLQDQRDLYACSLVSRTFNRAITPILYRSWDTRVVVDLPANDRFARSHKVFWPFIVQREILIWTFLFFVFSDLRPGSNLFGNTRTVTVREARSSHRWATFPLRERGCGSDDSYPGSIHKFGTKLFDNLLTALRKCEHLESFTWTEQADRLTIQPHEDPMAHSVADLGLRGVTKVLRELPITDLTIRSYVGLSEGAWSELIKISGLKKLSLWCMEGQPRVLQGWSETLGGTLTHLELGVGRVSPPSVSLSDLI